MLVQSYSLCHIFRIKTLQNDKTGINKHPIMLIVEVLKVQKH